jgi:hypothetical protein
MFRQSYRAALAQNIRLAILIFLAAAFDMISCSRMDVPRSEPSLTPPTEIQSLNESANDPSRSRTERAKAIFALFANHIKVGDCPAEVHKALIRTDWMSDSRLEDVGAIGGWVPLELDNDDPRYRLLLFPNKKGKSEWRIYFRISGPRDEDYIGRLEDYIKDGREFLMGRTTLPGNPRLMEFALCGPGDFEITRYTANGKVDGLEGFIQSSPSENEPQGSAATDQPR